MSSKLDQSLDEIAGARRNNNRRSARKPAAVVGGIAKKTTARVPGAKPNNAAPRAPAAPQQRGESKIIVSNLPDDVTEQQIKEYFASTVGPVKRVMMTYTKIGRSAGVATIVFNQPNSAAEAAKTYDGVKVDGRPMKIEVIMGAQHVAAPPAPKGLKDRIAGPKSAAAKPKAGANAKAPANAATNGAAPAAGKKGRKGGRVRRPKKTADELDADMADYFDPNAAAGTTAANGAAAPAAVATTGGETAMVEDEIM